MANIKLSELSPAGSELFQGRESFLNELSDRELSNVVGGSDSAASVSGKTMVSDISGGGVYYANYGNADYAKIGNFGALEINIKPALLNFGFSVLII
jgi:bacteriocin-like protein